MEPHALILAAMLGLAPAAADPGPSAATPEGSNAARLERLSAEANAALMRGDMRTYAKLIPIADDFTLMSPMGGEPSRGPYTTERLDDIGRFFRNGTLEQRLVQSYATPDMVVLVTIERAHVEVGGLPAQEWLLRVTQVYRRAGSQWELVHRHADPLAKGISLEQSAALTLGLPEK
jgi:ketosteroid isomerase-like protein